MKFTENTRKTPQKRVKKHPLPPIETEKTHFFALFTSSENRKFHEFRVFYVNFTLFLA